MFKSKVTGLIFGLSLSILPLTLQAETYDDYSTFYDGYSQDCCCDQNNCCCNDCCDPNLLYVQHTEGRGIGYNEGYTTLGLFYAPYALQWDENVQLFLDVRGHIFNNRKCAANAGGGIRYIAPCLNKVFGFNAYYDYRQDQGDYNQFGLGVEMLGCDFDLRANGYLVVGSHTHIGPERRFDFEDGFFANVRSREQSFSGIDAELSSSLRRWGVFCCCDWDIYGGIGPYYYRGGGCERNILGGQFRIGARYLDYLTLEVRAGYDNIFRGTAQGTIGLSIPFGYDDCQPCCNSNLKCLATQPVHRNEIIVTRKRCVWDSNF
ncbi:MAG: inverse autotransporter beta domain-containing protein [Parachlamydiaceae bacterium]|nr:inverse autotransporter beta domain-containing protein [Parachlamydiaceae bacterium]